MSKLKKFVLLACFALVPMLMAPSGGFPSRPTFQSATATKTYSSVLNGTFLANSDTPVYEMRESDAAANNRIWFHYVNTETYRLGVATDAGVQTNAILIDRTAGVIDSVNLTATAVQGNGVDMTPTSGGNTPTWNGFSSITPPALVYHKVGRLACIQFNGTTGTSNATTFSISGLPVSLSLGYRIVRVVDNSVAAVGLMQVSGTTLTFFTSVASAGFTASGTKGIADFNECFYS